MRATISSAVMPRSELEELRRDRACPPDGETKVAEEAAALFVADEPDKFMSRRGKKELTTTSKRPAMPSTHSHGEPGSCLPSSLDVVSFMARPFSTYKAPRLEDLYKLKDEKLTIAGNEPGNPMVPASFDAPGARKIVFTRK